MSARRLVPSLLGVGFVLLLRQVFGAPAAKQVTKVTTLAGAGTAGFTNGVGRMAKFNHPMGLVVDHAGNFRVIVADTDNHRIRMITRAGTVTTIAGSEYPGLADGKGARAEFNHPSGVAVDRAGNIIVADTDNDRIRKIAPDGTVTTIAGSSMGYRDGKALEARFDSPYAVAVDAANNIIVADGMNRAIRRITPSGLVTTIIGGFRKPAAVGIPGDVAVTSEGRVYVVNALSHGLFAVGNNGDAAIVYPYFPYSAEHNMIGIALDRDGALIASDDKHMIGKIADHTWSLIAGNGPGFVNGHARAARFNRPSGIAVDARGMIYVADSDNHAIRIIDRFAKEEKRPTRPPLIRR